MPDDVQRYSSSQGKSSAGHAKKIKVTHELVMSIADRVYAMLLREMKIERERNRFWNTVHPRKGGWKC